MESADKKPRFKIKILFFSILAILFFFAFTTIQEEFEEAWQHKKFLSKVPFTVFLLNNYTQNYENLKNLFHYSTGENEVFSIKPDSGEKEVFSIKPDSVVKIDLRTFDEKMTDQITDLKEKASYYESIEAYQKAHDTYIQIISIDKFDEEGWDGVISMLLRLGEIDLAKVFVKMADQTLSEN